MLSIPPIINWVKRSSKLQMLWTIKYTTMKKYTYISSKEIYEETDILHSR
ncbi:hypothetical protein MtrunA17_Chr3g0114051 [Medicago truncatula]|uniref:Uncharacterized protein n=1 Tax=Medicago truncatula TaxID=3880 RepID=A0A396IRY2_MEDTR|nr:hypothetical protein MtrunA17_Chr3g0114051 [Medicago truncatula]